PPRTCCRSSPRRRGRRRPAKDVCLADYGRDVCGRLLLKRSDRWSRPSATLLAVPDGRAGLWLQRLDRDGLSISWASQSARGVMNHETAVSKAKDIADSVLAPAARQHDKEGRFSTEAVAALGQAGLLGLMLPTEIGGAGLGPRGFAAVTMTIA